ncbi:MAG: hypothetical protein JWM77_1148 [Rhodospirillales bacterium]|jgi:uncharacterized protein YcbK (DUF882 family)|nr:hypothetical protein [Rhodospirillales bacterium]
MGDATPHGVSRRRLLARGTAMLVVASVAPAALATPRAIGGRELSFVNLHTGEKLTAEFAHGGRYVPSALRAIEKLLRDHRSGDVHHIDPHLLDQIHVLRKRVGSKAPFHVISGYRSPHTNAMLCEQSSAVAVNSFHCKGQAIDVRLPGVSLTRLRKAALSMEAGGVGYYPDDDFVHVDTGPVRRW